MVTPCGSVIDHVKVFCAPAAALKPVTVHEIFTDVGVLAGIVAIVNVDGSTAITCACVVTVCVIKCVVCGGDAIGCKTGAAGVKFVTTVVPDKRIFCGFVTPLGSVIDHVNVFCSPAPVLRLPTSDHDTFKNVAPGGFIEIATVDGNTAVTSAWLVIACVIKCVSGIAPRDTKAGLGVKFAVSVTPLAGILNSNVAFSRFKPKLVVPLAVQFENTCVSFGTAITLTGVFCV